MRSLVISLVAGAATLFGCQSEILRSPTLSELESGRIGVYQVDSTGEWDVYTVYYEIDVPCEMAWESTLGTPDWLIRTPFSKEFKELEPDSEDPPDTRRYLVTWRDDSKQEIVLKRDPSKRQIDVTVTSGDTTPGSPGHCTITMGPFLEGSTLVRAIIRIRNTFARRLASLLVTPVDPLGILSQKSSLRLAWESLAREHLNASVALNVRRQPSTGRTHVIAIGVGASEKSQSWPQLRYAESDAKAVFDWATRAYPDDSGSTTRILLTGSEAQSIKIGSILSRLGKSPDSILSGDTIIFFFAGHMDREVDVLEPHQPWKTYLVVTNSEKDNLRFTGIRKDHVLNAMRASPASQCVFICDACYSGGTRVLSPDQLQPFRTRGTAAASPPTGDGRLAVLAAAEELGQAAESDEVAHGIFTFALLRGLEGKADRDKDGYVTLDELSDYLNAQVPAHTRSMQVPYTSYSQSSGSGIRWPIIKSVWEDEWETMSNQRTGEK